MNITDILKRAQRLAMENSPAILTAVAVTGVVTRVVLTGKATLKAAQVLEAEKNRRSFRIGEPQELELRESIEMVWKHYIPPVVAVCTTITCIVMANRIGERRAAAAASLFAISEKAFTDYKEKVIEKIGENKEREVRDEIAQDRVNADPVSNREVIITGNGEVLCYDMFSGRYFQSDMESLRKAENDTNHQMLRDTYVSLSDFYYKIGLRPTSDSDNLGWVADGAPMELKYSTVLSEDNKPCIAIDFSCKPFRGFWSGH